MRTAGARVTKEPVDAEFFKGHSAYVCDPKANYFEITWAKPNNPITAWRPNKNSARGHVSGPSIARDGAQTLTHVPEPSVLAYPRGGAARS